MARLYLALAFLFLAVPALATPPVVRSVPQVAQPGPAADRFQVYLTDFDIVVEPNTSASWVYDLQWLFFVTGGAGNFGLTDFTLDPGAGCENDYLEYDTEACASDMVCLRITGECDTDGAPVTLGHFTGLTIGPVPGSSSGGGILWEGPTERNSFITVTGDTTYDLNYEWQASALICQLCYCDVNEDGGVGGPDYSIIGMNFGMSGYDPYEGGDCTGDGTVGGADLLEYADEQGQIGCCLGQPD